MCSFDWYEELVYEGGFQEWSGPLLPVPETSTENPDWSCSPTSHSVLYDLDTVMTENCMAEQSTQQTRYQEKPREMTPRGLIRTAMMSDAAWLNFPQRPTKRARGKQPWYYNRNVHTLMEKEEVDTIRNYSKADRDMGFVEFNRVFSMVTGQTFTKARPTAWKAWTVASVKDREAWYFIQDLRKQVYTSVPGKARERIPLPDGAILQKIRDDNTEDPLLCESLGVLLTYHTNVGEQNPQAVSVQEQDLPMHMIKEELMAIHEYEEVYHSFKDFITNLARQTHCPRWATCMELNPHADRSTRVHLHAFLGQECSYLGFVTHMKKVRFHLSTVLFRGIRPHAQPMRPRGPSGVTVASAHGLYYVLAPKIGQMWSDGNIKPFEDFAVAPRTILGLWQARKLEASVARKQLLRTRARGVQAAVQLIDYIESEEFLESTECERAMIKHHLKRKMVGFIPHETVSAWKRQYNMTITGYLHRHRMLLMRGKSRSGKTMFAKAIFGEGATLLVNCQGLTDVLPDLRHFNRRTHRCIVFDECNPKQILANKAFFQAGIEPIQMAQSHCGAHRYFVWVYGTAFVLCSNKFSLEADPVMNITQEDSEWLKKNIQPADLQGDQKWYIGDDVDQDIDLDSGHMAADQ